MAMEEGIGTGNSDAAVGDDACPGNSGNRYSYSLYDRPLESLLHRSLQVWRQEGGKHSRSGRTEAAFLKKTRAELAALPPDILMKRCREAEAKALNEFDESLVEVPLVVMQPKYQADVNRWGRYKAWSIEEAVALYLDRDPDHFKFSDLENLGRKSVSLTKAQDFRRLAEHAVQAGELLERTAPCKLVDWAEGYHHAFPERLVESVNQHQREETPNLRVHEQWERMGTKRQNNVFRLLVAMAIDQYGFNPFRKPSHGPTAMSNSMKAIGFNLTPGAISLMLQIIGDGDLDQAKVEECLAQRAKRIRAERKRS